MRALVKYYVIGMKCNCFFIIIIIIIIIINIIIIMQERCLML